ncbi:MULTISPECIES: hypothetical protein [unclassified Microbacterium]|uniref:hypothetical protein n=1 Tax=unclassified Microbacterium TaxID=2609290 RepID=UPI003016A8FA
MSARVIDDARAFEIIAPHLDEARRQEIAEAIALRLAPSAGKRSSVPSTSTEPAERPEYAIAESDPAVAYLRSLGFAEGELVRAAGRLAAAVRAHWRGEGQPPERVIAALWDQITAEARP